jgi:hypothetical protein
MSKKPKINPHCPVPGCKTKLPHSARAAVDASLRELSDPVKLALWTKSCIVELIQSAIDDVNKPRLFAYLTRWRTPEELYHRALYILFIADAAELPHIFSGEPPNSFTAMWRKVNEVIFEGRGALETVRLGLNGEEFSAMNDLNQNAHASYTTMLTCLGLMRNPKHRELIPQHIDHWKRLCDYLNYMEQMFAAGKSKSDVMTGVMNLHRPRQSNPKI